MAKKIIQKKSDIFVTSDFAPPIPPPGIDTTGIPSDKTVKEESEKDRYKSN